MGASNPNQNRKIYKLKIEKETNVPAILLQKKEGSVWVTAETFSQITGFLKKIELDSYEWEGDIVDKMRLYFDDDDAKDASFTFEAGFNYCSRSILNSLAGAGNINHVKIRVYTANAKDGSGKIFPQAYVEINKQKSNWKYKPEEIPKAKEVKVGKKVLKDDSEVNEFFKLLIPEINSKIISEQEVKSEMQSQPQNGAKEKTGELVPDNLPDDSSDLPFHSPYNQKIPFMVRRTTFGKR